MFRLSSIACVLALLAAAPAALRAQTPPVPKPFPQPGQAGGQAAPVVKPQEAPKPITPTPAGVPTEASLGLPPGGIFTNAEFITSYDAGQGQRYYLFGTNAPFATVVAYYKNVLKDKGELVFEEPPVHEFDIGRFREETMAFPPSITVKDYTWGGMEGYLNPVPGAQPQRFRTIIQIVPVPSGS